MFYKIDVTTSFPTNNLKQDYTKAEDIGLHREYSSIAYSGAMYPLFGYQNKFFFLFFIFFCFLLKKPIRREIKEVAYYVPTTLLVLSIFWFSLQILAIPKSDILATMSWSNNTLLGFKSLLIGQECIDPL